MKKLLIITVIVLVVSLFTGSQVMATPDNPNTCTTIQSGELEASDGSIITVGYDEWGYNYQSHLFNGNYCAYDRDASDCEYPYIKLNMKWNDAWLSNKDCDGDGVLDRHYGYDSYIGSGAWITNHMSGEYEWDGKTCNWYYFTKIVAVPEDATLENGVWFTADGTEIGPVIWGQFATIQSVYNSPCEGVGGVEYLSPANAGLGGW